MYPATVPADRAFIVVRRPARADAGFTLIDLLVSVGIAAVLAAIAYPSFEAQIHRARRADALVALTNVQMAEERWRANAASYGSLAQIGMASASTSGDYTLAVTAPSANGYVVTAQAAGAQARDTACRYLKLTVDNGHATQASGPQADVANDDVANRRCWGQG